MKRKISLSAFLLLGALPLAAIAAEPEALADNSPTKESTGEYIDDAAITAKVKTAFLQDKDVKAINVKMETFKGNVQLSGFAEKSIEIERAVQIASKVPGVMSVQNSIRLRSP
ncbi:MAG: BON domain-containing protein [Rhodocyclaceae bacterium]